MEIKINFEISEDALKMHTYFGLSDDFFFKIVQHVKIYVLVETKQTKQHVSQNEFKLRDKDASRAVHSGRDATT